MSASKIDFITEALVSGVASSAHANASLRHSQSNRLKALEEALADLAAQNDELSRLLHTGSRGAITDEERWGRTKLDDDGLGSAATAFH
jgi:hypothetical protein